MRDQQRLLTASEAAQLLRILPARLKRLAKAGQVPHVQLPDGDVRFDADDLRKWVEEHKVPASA